MPIPPLASLSAMEQDGVLKEIAVAIKTAVARARPCGEKTL